jgi:thiol-disulfide isomerase/thioredoxin
MKYLHLLSLLLLGSTVSSAKTAPPEKFVTLTCTFDNCSMWDSLTLYKFDGMYYKAVQTIKQDAKTHLFSAAVPMTQTPQYYYIGVNLDQQKLKAFVLGTEERVLLTGPCFSLPTTTAQSKLNNEMDGIQKRVNAFKIRLGKLYKEYVAAKGNDNQRIEIEKKMGILDKERVRFLDSLNKKNSFFAKAVAADTYVTYQNAKNKAKFADEKAYFATQYFQFVNFKDTGYDQVPQLAEQVHNYASVLLNPLMGLKQAEQKQYFDHLLSQVSDKSKTYKYILSGIVNTLFEKKLSLALEYGERYLRMYGAENKEQAAQIGQQLSYIRANLLDVPAPEIVAADTSGKKTLALSSLKGKYVLLDFWASWCGPCRKENPNVVALYAKYKSKGFDVFSVSLDQDKSRWIQAIENDKLSWASHVSDLKGWASEPARMYSVTGIPTTLLLDKEGNIIARNLRGEQLTMRLKELLGE